METTTDNTQGMESNIQPTDAAAASTGGDTSGVDALAAAAASATANANAGQPTFTPNYKFKAGDFEGEVDEFLRPIIKDADTEKKIKDLYTKAHGLDAVKSRLTGEVESWKTKANDHIGKYTQLSESLSNLSFYVNRGDFDSFFNALKIPQAAVYKWVNAKIQEQEMTPEQRAETQRNREESHRLFLLEKQNQELMQRQEAIQVERNMSLLDQTISSPEVSSIAQEFDAKVGMPGAFKTEVLKRGVALYHVHGRDLHPSEVVKDLMGTLGKVFQPTQASAGMQGNQGQAAPPQRPPVIPNVQGKSTSPVKTAPKSIKELRERASNM
jgi:hypothetical protein